MKPTVIDPKTTSRAEAYDLWMSAPNPMVTFFKTLDVTPLYRLSHRRGLKFNMLLCWCIRAMGQYDGNICYCIEPGVSQQPGDSLTKKGEDFWDNYPAAYNKTISPENIKLLIGRIFQYGYTGPILVSWRLQNDGGDKLANAHHNHKEKVFGEWVFGFQRAIPFSPHKGKQGERFCPLTL